jgi:hypothetical protein
MVAFYIGQMAYFVVAFLVVLPLLVRFLERKYNIKIKYNNTTFFEVSGGTPTQRFGIPILMVAYVLVVAGLSVLALWLSASP